MDNLSFFVDSLQDLMVQRNVKVGDIVKATELSDTMIYNWLRQETVPKLNTLVILADYFQCSVDYLCGRTDNEAFTKSANPSSFSARLCLLMQEKKASYRKLRSETKISMTAIHRFRTGAGKPLLDSLIRLAVFFGCSIDYLLGRSD